MTDFQLQMLEMLTGGYTREDVQNTRQQRPPETYIGKLIHLAAWGFDLIHKSAGSVLWDDMEHAQGAALDRYGKNFGVARNNTEDDFYRLMIQVKMMAQISGGDIDTLIGAAAALMGVHPDKVDLNEVFPAKVWIYIDEIALSKHHIEVIDIIAQMMKRIVAAGVGMRIFLRTKTRFNKHIYVNTGVSSYILTTAKVASEEDKQSWQTIKNTNT